jgi:hypothetical protein
MYGDLASATDREQPAVRKSVWSLLVAFALAVVPAMSMAATTAKPANATAQPATPAKKPVAKPAAKPVVAKPTVTATKGDNKIRLDAALRPGGKLVDRPIEWTITKASKDPAKPAEALVKQKGPTVTTLLAAGDYVVTAKLGFQEVSEPLQVGPGKPTHKTIDLKAGYLHLAMVPTAAAARITTPITWELYQYSRGTAAKDSPKIASVIAPQTEFYVPGGSYTIRALYEKTSSEIVIPLPAGTNYDYTINLYGGRLNLTAVNARGVAPVDDVKWEIVKAVPDPTGKRETVVQLQGPAQDFLVREGKYVAIVRSAAIVYEIPFEIKSGRPTRVKATLKPTGTTASVN